jgi:hypothetical protein
MQAKLKGNCNKTLRWVELDHSMWMVQSVLANLHQEVLVNALSIIQAVIHIRMLKVLLKAKDLLLQVRRTSLQIHHLPQWDLLPRVVGFNVLSVVDVAML